MKEYEGSGGIAPPFLTSALDWVSGQIHASAAAPPGDTAPDTHWIGGWVDSRAGLGFMEMSKICLLVPRIEPQSLY
jgi:hypothetical protein